MGQISGSLMGRQEGHDDLPFVAAPIALQSFTELAHRIVSTKFFPQSVGIEPRSMFAFAAIRAEVEVSGDLREARRFKRGVFDSRTIILMRRDNWILRCHTQQAALTIAIQEA